MQSPGWHGAGGELHNFAIARPYLLAGLDALAPAAQLGDESALN